MGAIRGSSLLVRLPKLFYQSSRSTAPLTSAIRHSSWSFSSISRQQPAPTWTTHTIPRLRHHSTTSAPSETSSSISTSTSTSTSAEGSAETSSSKPPSPRITQQPHYEITFTCIPCSHRSTHTISKQGFHYGSVLITCPECRNRHVISDHLKIFGDRKITVEDLMRERGRLVKKGTLGEDGDLEFWEDGTVTPRDARQQQQQSTRASGEGREENDDTSDTAHDAAPGTSFKKN